MSNQNDATRIRRWQRQVALDPGSPAFLPLAELYRREGRREVARRLCVRGLERHPEHVEAHLLLGRIYRENGDLEQALDEIDIAVRLAPDNHPARRALGYLCLELRQWSAAAHHLEVAIEQDPRDERLSRALALARHHAAAADPQPGEDEGSELPSSLVAALRDFIRETRVRSVLLMEANGRILLDEGFPTELDLGAFASLGAGIHSASGALALMLGQSRFGQLYQGAGERQIFLGPLSTGGAELILVTVFGASSTIGLVRVRFGELARAYAEVAWWPAIRPKLHDAPGFDAELQAGLRFAGPSGAGGAAPRLG